MFGKHPAFPSDRSPTYRPGLSTRDHIAIQIMASIMAGSGDSITHKGLQSYAKQAYAAADALLEESNKE